MNAFPKGRVSVIIPTFRRHDTLALAVKSALLQGEEIREVLVVDDNRRPEDEGRVQAVLNKINDSRVVYLRNLGSVGGSASRNIAIRRASAPFLAFLDDDDQWLPGKINAQLELMTPGVVGVDCGYIECDYAWGLMLCIRGESKIRNQTDLLKGYCPTSTSLVLIRRDIAIKAGLFDERLSSFEDYDFWIRCSAFGSFTTVNKPFCIYVQHAGYRLSLSNEARLKGLDEFLLKWGNRIGNTNDIATLRRHWKLVAMASNARRALPNSRIESLSFAWQALLTAPTRKHGWQSVLFALAGFHIARLLSRCNNISRSLSHKQTSSLTEYQTALATSDPKTISIDMPT